MCGNDTASCDTQPGAPQETGGWNPFIDFVVFRYYIDGEEEASIQFSPNMACGVGPFANRTSSSPTPVNPAVGPHVHDVQAGGRPAAGEPMGTPQAHAPWSALYFGKGSADGGWFTDGQWISQVVLTAICVRLRATVLQCSQYCCTAALTQYNSSLCCELQ